MFSFINSKKLDVLKVFFNKPKAELSIRELSRQSTVSPRWVSKTVSELGEEQILEKQENPANTSVSIGEEFKTVKRIYNLSQLYNTGLVEHLEKELRPEAIVLFGSYEKGEDLEDSDIDIAVISGRNKEISLEKFEKELNRTINIQHIEDSTKTDKNFRNSLANGTVLDGFAKVI